MIARNTLPKRVAHPLMYVIQGPVDLFAPTFLFRNAAHFDDGEVNLRHRCDAVLDRLRAKFRHSFVGTHIGIVENGQCPYHSH